MQINNNDLIKEVAKETGNTQEDTKKVFQSVFEFVNSTFKADKLESIRLPYFGIFIAKSKIDYKINKK